MNEHLEKVQHVFFLEKGISNHPIYKNIHDGHLWQFCYYGDYKPLNDKVVPFPGSYEDVIPHYGLSPNQMIQHGIFKKLSIIEIIIL